MRFHISATIEVADPQRLLAAGRAHAAAWESLETDDPQIDELAPDAAAVLAAALTNQLDFAAFAEDADTDANGAEWAELLRAADGPVSVRVTDTAGNCADYSLGEQPLSEGVAP